MVTIVGVISALVMLLLIFSFFFANWAHMSGMFQSLNQEARKFGKGRARPTARLDRGTTFLAKRRPERIMSHLEHLRHRS